MDNNQYPNNNQQQQAPQYQAPMYPQAPQNHPAKNLALASMICGIVGLVFGWAAGLIGIPAGIVGLILAINAKKKGFVGGMLTAGLIMSIISLALGAIVFIACIGIVGCSACAAAGMGSSYYW